MKRWLRYGIVGNFLTYGIGFGFLAYLGWIVWDIGQTQSSRMDQDLAKEFFTFSDAQLKQSAKKAKLKFMQRKEAKLRKQREHSQERSDRNKRAQYI